MSSFEELSSAELLSLCLWGESRGESVEGMIGVGCVVRNRVDRRKSTYTAQILKPLQFSCFNTNDPNRAKLESMAENLASYTGDPVFRQCLWVSRGVVDGMVRDNTKGADHYLTLSLYRQSKVPWARDETKVTTVIGNHVFLNLEG